MTTNTVTQNPWIFSTPIAAQISAEDIEQRRTSLREWSIETGKRLPLPAEWIIRLELAGWIVDLDTGQRRRPDPVPVPTAAGIVAARTWTTAEEDAR